MEPLRASSFTFAGTYVIDAIWIIAALVVIILNQVNVIPKTRRYECTLIMWDKTFGQLHRIDYASRVKRLEKKQHELIQNGISGDELKEVDNRLNATRQHYERLESKHLIRQSNYKREGNRILYYNGR